LLKAKIWRVDKQNTFPQIVTSRWTEYD